MMPLRLTVRGILVVLFVLFWLPTLTLRVADAVWLEIQLAWCRRLLARLRRKSIKMQMQHRAGRDA